MCSYHWLGQQQEGENPLAEGSILSSAEHPQLPLAAEGTPEAGA